MTFSFNPPTNQAEEAAWLAWLDANRLAPIAAHKLAETQLSPSLQKHLQQALTQARAQWLLRKLALQKLLSLTASELASPIILLKGAALALNLYDEPGLRLMNDIDLMAVPEDMPNVLGQMRNVYLERGLSAGNDIGYLHHFLFTDPATNIQLELHKTLPLLVDQNHLTWFLQQTETHYWKGFTFQTFTPSAQLLHLSSHAVLEHGGEQGALAIWFYDIHKLITRWGRDIDWEEILWQAKKLQWEAALHEAISISHKLFATPIPPAIVSWLQLPQIELSGYNVLRQMTSAHRSSSLTVFHVLRGLTWRQRGQQIFGMIFPSRNYMQRRYPHIPRLFAYPYRWFDATRKLLPALFRR